MTGIVVVAVVLFLIAATFLGPARPISKALSSFLNQPVRMEVWGQVLPGSEIESIITVGVGINLKVSGHPLKIAQPKGMTRTESAIEIAYARYVQWDRRRIAQPEGAAAVSFRRPAVSHNGRRIS